MIRVTIELLPYGRNEGREILKVIDIANDGTGTVDRGNYKVRFGEQTWKDKVVTNWPRQSYPVDKLLYKVLDTIHGK